MRVKSVTPVYSSYFVSIYFSQTSPSSMSKYWVCQDKQHHGAECLRNSTFPDASIADSFCASVAVPGLATTSTISSEWSPASVAAHLHLLGEALFLIGLHLKGTNVSIILLLFYFFFKNIRYIK